MPTDSVVPPVDKFETNYANHPSHLPTMSKLGESTIISDGRRRNLYDDARVKDEFATTRFWEYIFQKQFFPGPNWVLSSQQPPTLAVDHLRRVDLTIEHFSSQSNPQTVLFMEAKKHGAPESDIRAVETQAFDASMQYSYYVQNPHPIWVQTCVGTSTRFWIYSPGDDFLTAFLPGAFGQADQDKYLDADEFGGDIIRAVTYIARHHIPPNKFIGSRTPSVSTVNSSASEPPQSPSSAARTKLEDLAAASKAPIPLEEGFWSYMEITSEVGEQLVGYTHQGVEVNTPKKDWWPHWRTSAGAKSACYVYIAPSREVYYTWKLEPIMH
ncbi:hypothetical protein VM1G_10403 [Cytospora mali]|uniref:Uncharacterized protein n=1 Tax=Cytospora mali TaxID=578113 RepID=A0A194VHG8_CYTMA|nr:hypothetical protein VM1G_10403 [Valsa mali]